MVYNANMTDDEVLAEIQRLAALEEIDARALMVFDRLKRRIILCNHHTGRDYNRYLPNVVTRDAPALEDAQVDLYACMGTLLTVLIEILAWILFAVRLALKNIRLSLAALVVIVVAHYWPWLVRFCVYVWFLLMALVLELVEIVFKPPPVPETNVPYCLQWLFGTYERDWQYLLALAVAVICIILALICYMIALCRPVKVREERVLEKVIYNQTAVGDYVPERMNPGSVFLPGKLPLFQMWVERLEDGQWKKVGCAFRTELGIYTAKHVPNGTDFRLTTEANMVEVPYDQVRELDADAILIPENFAPSGVTRAKLTRGALMGANTVQVEICNGVHRSIGPVVASKSFGSVVYSGSTVGGFSGAPYYSGKNILGMHTGAAAVNFGYEAGYLAVLSVKKEDSQDVILDWLKRGNKFAWKVSPFDPDEVFIRTGRGYDTVESQRFYDVLEDIMSQEAEDAAMEAAMGGGEGYRAFKPKLSRSQRKTYSSGKQRFTEESGFIFPDSGNLSLPAAVAYPSAGNTQFNRPGVNQPNPQTSQEMTSPSPSTSRQAAMDPPKRKPVPKNEASVSMLLSMLQDISKEPTEERLRAVQSLTARLIPKLMTQLQQQSNN